MGPLGLLFGCLLAASGLPGPLLARLVSFLACSWKTLGPPLAALGPLLGRSWAAPGLSWPALWASWASLGGSWAAFGSEEQIFAKTLIRPVFYGSDLASRAPRWPQVGPNLAQVGPKMAQVGPSWPQVGPNFEKTPPKVLERQQPDKKEPKKHQKCLQQGPRQAQNPSDF